ncbi:efflux RND transporter periplasmic adaptor subunit [Altererythrobacter sp. CAU 1778]
MNYETSVQPDAGTMDRSDLSGEIREERSVARWKWPLIAIAVLIIAAVIYAIATGGAEEDTSALDNQVPVVSVIKPGRTTIDGEIEASGSLAARREIQVGVVGEGGRVVSVAVDAGSWVNQGQVLVSIDRSVQNQQLASAQAQIGVAQADLNLAQANLERALKLVERGFISQADIDRLTATRDAARSRVQVARASVGELQARNARLNIYAPSSGLVLSRSVEVGQVVSAGSPPLFTIARGGEMEMLAQVGESDLAKLSTGVAAEVIPVGTERTFTGQVWQLAPTISETDRQGTARIALAYDRALRPGGFATAKIKSGTMTAPILPESAVLSDAQGSFVYVVTNDSKAELRRVTLGTVTAAGIVVAEGLNGNEQVVLRAGGFLNDGEAVQVGKVENSGR